MGADLTGSGRRSAFVATIDANQVTGAIDPWLGAAMSARRRHLATSAITGARSPGVTKSLELMQGPDPARRPLPVQLSEAFAWPADALPRLAAYRGNRLYNELPAAIAPPPRSVVGRL